MTHDDLARGLEARVPPQDGTRPGEDLRPARLATRLSFVAAGFGIACWAPLIPFVKDRLGVAEGAFGLLLLCLGIGSVIAMPVTGIVAARRGARPMVLLGGFGMVLMLPLLALVPEPWMLGVVLALFGASLGTIDVAMNVHAVEVEGRGDRPMMSGFHAMFSLGGFAGAGLMTALLWLGLSPLQASLIGAALMAAAMAPTGSRMLRARAEAPPPFSLPRGVVILLAVLAGITFLIEGAVLDWGALLLITRDLAAAETAGAGFMIFSAAMVAGRLAGDRIVSALGPFRVLVAGGVMTIIGLALTLIAPGAGLALMGFLLIGLGASNLVPVLFSAAGRQRIMPAGMAIAAVTTTGYAGVLLGPAAIGGVAEATSLPFAFWGLALLVLAVPATAHRVARI
ncbi:MFS transporter [Histidinibacterium lentulum]|uniref:MFS transporter n=1 Tax=Histidinibacterium lentulum TaxID=2480588 RepID=A0A3N2QTS5_9RHOB|nr:MFS transporter [Histidinibacterium lentulum]ROT98570.1 MFS transporter [Histidinibacterium lentulum]